MNLWVYLTKKFGKRSRGTEAYAHLAGCYQRVLMPGSTATNEDKQIVLADLANKTGFFRVSGMGFSAEDRAFSDGMRAVYGVIHTMIRMTDDERRSLEEAARQEAIADAQQE